AVDGDGEVDTVLVDELGERAQDGRGRQHGRADPHARTRLPDACGDELAHLVTATGGEERAHGRTAVEPGGTVVERAGAGDVTLRPQLLEVLRVRRREIGRLHRDDEVLHARPRVGRPVGRPRPHRGAVADDVLVVHQIGDAGDGL